MRSCHLKLAPPSWLRLPRRTARLRLTFLYGGLFLAFGAVLLAITYVLSERAIDNGQAVPLPALSGVHVHAVEPPPGSQAQASLAAANREVAAQRAADLHHLLVSSGIALAIVGVLAILLGWYVAGRVLRPVRTITATARRISASSLHERLALDDADKEFKDLGDTLDDLFARLEASFEAQRHFADNASHELRTPLAADRALLQFTLEDPAPGPGIWRSACEDLLASNAEQEQLIEALLTLASSEGGIEHPEPVDLSAVADTVLLVPHPEGIRLGLHVQATTEPAILHGDPVLAERLMANLVDNAFRHNVPGGDVQVSTGISGGCAMLSVASTGPVIRPEEVMRLFLPFQRLGPRGARRDGGHGLGLAIVRAIATAHGATITARPRPGGGLAIDIAFPPPCPVSAPQAGRPHAARADLA
jgi:signal transduction histidine kinase